MIGSWVRYATVLGLILIPVLAGGCSLALEAPAPAVQDNGKNSQIERKGIASYLSDEFHGQLTASGVPYDKDAMVAAHPSLPFEQQVEVTSLDNGQSIIVTIVDRLPEKVESIIDLSSAAATELGMLDAGEVYVTLRLIHADTE